MKPFRVIVAELATGKVRKASNPDVYSNGAPGESWSVFAGEEDALRFKDEILKRYAEFEVVVLADDQSGDVRRYFSDHGKEICEVTKAHGKSL